MQRRLRELILEIFGDQSNPAALESLGTISICDWNQLLDWMDASGIALYFLARVTETDVSRVLPRVVLERLQQNLRDNRERTAASITELLRIQDAFLKAGIQFLLLKGLSLVPQACPDAALRLQLDIDLMVEPRSSSAMQHALSTLGYHLSTVSGKTWEFKTFTDRLPDREDLYKPKSQRSVDIHVPSTNVFRHLHQTAEHYSFEGCSVPVLSAVERFLGQADHIDKHMRYEWSRVSWLLEFRNTIHFYRLNSNFWQQVMLAVRSSPSRWEALGAANTLARAVLPSMPEVDVLRESEVALSPLLKLWISRYGRRVLTSNFPGSKLYLLQPGHSATRGLRLLPLHAPQSVVSFGGRRTFAVRMHVLRDFTRHAVRRALFHAREAVLFMIEFVRWHHLLAQNRDVVPAPASAGRGDSRAEASL